MDTRRNTIVNAIRSHPVLATTGGMVLLALVLPAIFPVYFREDDVGYIHWARTHSLLDCCRPSQAVLFGMFRPVQNAVWWILYHTAGLDPYPYHVVLVFSYMAAHAAFFGFVQAVASRGVAVISVIAYGVCFHHLTYVVFWFSDFTYTLELLFAHSAMWLFARAVNVGSRRHLAGSVILYGLSAAAKEPAAVLVPLVCLQVVVTKWGSLDGSRRRHLVITALLMGVIGGIWLAANSSLWNRQGISLWQGMGAIADFVAPRWSYYAGVLTAFPTIGVWAAVGFLVSRRLLAGLSVSGPRLLCYSSVLGILAALCLKQVPGVALGLLFAGLLALVVLRDAGGGVGAIWAAPALAGVMSLNYVVRTYLVEPSFGLALICGQAGGVLMEGFARYRGTPASPRWKWSILAAGGAAIIAGVALAPMFSRRLDALRNLSHNRQSFGDAIGYILRNGGTPGMPLVVIDYEDMGLDYERDVLPLGDSDKAVLQKTMTSGVLRTYLAPSGVDVRSLGWWKSHPEAREASLVTMNTREEGVLDGLPARKRLTHEWARGTMRVRLYHLSRE